MALNMAFCACLTAFVSHRARVYFCVHSLDASVCVAGAVSRTFRYSEFSNHFSTPEC